MAEKLTFKYDAIGDILYVNKCSPYAEQESQELDYGIVARLNPDTEEIENLEVMFFSKRLRDSNVFELPIGRSYHEYLISSLKNPESAASYIEVMLELESETPEPELLRAGLKDVVDAYLQMNKLSTEAKFIYEKLDRMLSESGGEEIYALIVLLDKLGLQLAVAVK